MATKETAPPKPEVAIAARYKREVARSALRTYRRVVKEFSRDAECTEEQAKEWLRQIGVQEPEAK